jgi:hypothetical protein
MTYEEVVKSVKTRPYEWFTSDDGKTFMLFSDNLSPAVIDISALRVGHKHRDVIEREKKNNYQTKLVFKTALEIER